MKNVGHFSRVIFFLFSSVCFTFLAGAAFSQTNLALNKTCSASSNAGACGNAFNGDTTSRWESAHGSDNEWLYVDLGQSYSIDAVTIHWEHSLALVFKVQVWNDDAAPTNDDDTRWVTVHDFTADGGSRWPAGWPDDGRTFLDEITFTATDARYVRVRLLDREFQWGFSIWDMFVFEAGGGPVTKANLALNQPCAASSNNGNCGNAFNGDTTSRWESTHGSDDEWIYVDLGQTYGIDAVTIHWEHSLALEFKIQVWNDAATPTADDDARWVTVHDFVADGNARWPAGWPDDGRTFLDEITFNAVNARYVRVRLLKREFQWGFSIWDMFVYGGEAVNNQKIGPLSFSVRYQKTGSRIRIETSGTGVSHAEVLSADGRLVSKLESRGTAESLFWNTKDIENGLYYIRLFNGDDVSVMKIPVFGN